MERNEKYNVQMVSWEFYSRYVFSGILFFHGVYCSRSAYDMYSRIHSVLLCIPRVKLTFLRRLRTKRGSWAREEGRVKGGQLAEAT